MYANSILGNVLILHLYPACRLLNTLNLVLFFRTRDSLKN